MNQLKEVDFAVTLCNKEGIITFMNDKSVLTFKKDGGLKLIGTNVLDCHPEPSRTKLENMIKNETKNIYTIEKDGIKKLIFQTPFYENGVYSGFIELMLELPEQMKNFIRN